MMAMRACLTVLVAAYPGACFAWQPIPLLGFPYRMRCTKTLKSESCGDLMVNGTPYAAPSDMSESNRKPVILDDPIGTAAFNTRIGYNTLSNFCTGGFRFDCSPILRVDPATRSDSTAKQGSERGSFSKSVRKTIASIVLAFACIGIFTNSPVIALSLGPSDSGSFASDLSRTLKAPSEERPQITIPSSMKLDNFKERLGSVEALLYIEDDKTGKRYPPQATDMIVLTLHRIPLDGRTETDLANDPKLPILAGAKVPVVRTRFPSTVVFKEANLLPSPDDSNEDRWRVATTQDDSLLVRARICPKSASKSPCEMEEAAYTGFGVSKLIQDMPGWDGYKVRVGASVKLRPTPANEVLAKAAEVAAGEQVVQSTDEF